MLRPYANHPFAHNGAAGVSLAALFNITVIGQDWIMFLKQDSGQALQLTTHFWTDHNPLYWYFVLPQAWTIGLELTFYAIAPNLNRLGTIWLGAAALVGFAARLISYQFLGMDHDPWDYRFFPLEIGLFLFGMLAYRLYARMSSHPAFQRWQSTTWQSYLAGAAVLLILMYIHVRAVEFLGRITSPHIAALITCPLFILLIPALFLAFGKNKFDRLIGEMSYPVYLVHFIALVVIANLVTIAPGAGLARMTALASLCMAELLYAILIAPIDTRRHEISVKPRQMRSA
jgi:peptidoglycan/LPS O-acetylase OafA/YrhL